MYFQFLVEDKSGSILIEKLMGKLCQSYQAVEYRCKPFKGLGGFKKKATPAETKTGKLLNDLSIYLKGFDKSLQGIEAAIIVVVDNDTRNTEEFRSKLEDVAAQNDISIEHVFCIAVEEMEAWLLGDKDAIKRAYPNAKLSMMKSYQQDSICGTWEVLADVVYPGGVRQMKKECQTYMEIGAWKCEWAGKIGEKMRIDENGSPSFRDFITNIRRRMHALQP